MSRPTRLEILEYALTGVQTEMGLNSGQLTDDEWKYLDKHETWLIEEIKRVKEKQDAMGS